jgi:hypothetical protein
VKYMPECRDINIATRILLAVWENDVSAATRMFEPYKGRREGCGDEEGNVSIEEVVVSNLEYLALVQKPTKQQQSSINQFKKKNIRE